jgi:hypothetical protein
VAPVVDVAQVVPVGIDVDVDRDAMKKIQVSLSALLKSAGFQRSLKVAETSHLTQWL